MEAALDFPLPRFRQLLPEAREPLLRVLQLLGLFLQKRLLALLGAALMAPIAARVSGISPASLASSARC